MNVSIEGTKLEVTALDIHVLGSNHKYKEYDPSFIHIHINSEKKEMRKNDADHANIFVEVGFDIAF